ncbi:MAG: prepilin-type N-terminal cleavage/methylation domain-containing protein [Candidatus Xenobiia bacterium LiM19]
MDSVVSQAAECNFYSYSGLPEVRRRSGFTLTEVLITMFILNLVILLFLGSISFMLGGSQKLVDYSSGTYACSIIMENCLYNNSFPPTGETSGELYSEGIHFEYRLDVATVETLLRKVEVTVYWWDPKMDYKTGYGKLSTALCTLVREDVEVK